MKKAVIYTVMFLAIQLVASMLVMGVAMLTGQDQASPYVNILSMVVFSLATMGVFIRLGWAPASASYLQSRPWGVVLWCVVAAIGAVVPSMAVQEQLPELPNIVEEQLAQIMSARGGYFVVCLLAPVAEELVFRGAVLRALLQWQPRQRWAMTAVSALLFALVHLNPAQMPHAFVIGLLLGWLYCRTGSIVPGVAFHWANNTVAYVLFRLYPDPDLRLIDVLGTGQGVGAAVIFSLFILLPALYQLHLRTGRKC